MKQRKPTKEKVFDIDRVIIYKQSTGWFLASTVNGERVTGTSIIPPYGRIRVQAHYEPARESWHIYEMVYKDMDGVTYALLKSNFITGIADSKAESTFETFGSNIWAILDAAVNSEDYEDPATGRHIDPFLLLQDIDGVGPIVAKDMIGSWAEQREYFSIAMNAVRCNMATWQWREIAKNGTKAEIFDMMVHNQQPYSVYDLVQFGLSWEQCDSVALTDWDDKPALSPEHPIRLAGMVKFLITGEQKKFDSPYAGSSCIPIDDIDQLVYRMFGVENVYNKLPEEITSYGLVEFDNVIYPYRSFETELYIAKALVRNMKAGMVKKYNLTRNAIQSFAPVNDEGKKIHLVREQIDAILTVLTNSVSIITGGPGVGKTTILRVIVDVLKSMGEDVHLGAFTGAASRRMSLATGHIANTLHRTFNLFQAEQERIERGTLIIDENSMNSSKLLEQVLANVGPNVRIVLVGDPDQLPPIDWGEPFIQLIETNQIPLVRLTEVFRQKKGSAIAEACRLVNSGEVPTGDNEDVFIISAPSDKGMIERFDKAWEYFKQKFPEWNRQVLTPLNKRPMIGREDMNVRIQNRENPAGLKVPGTTIKIGDRVVSLKNNYPLETRNGMTGFAHERTETAVQMLHELDLAGSDKKAIGKIYDTYDLSQILIVDFEDEFSQTAYALNIIDEVTLAYAMTIHKAQGNQFDVVIVMLPKLPDSMRLRQIVYTAMSRAKEKLVVIERDGELGRCVKNERKLRRLSKLSLLFKTVWAEDQVDMLGWR